MDNTRQKQLKKWLIQCPEIDKFELTPASSDASFRRYFRVTCINSGINAGNNKSYIAMDAPPEKENSASFVAISKLLFDAGINVPEVHQKDFDKGFFLISDLGKKQYLAVLNKDTFEALYLSAIQVLIEIQQIPANQQNNIPDYDRNLLMLEMELFRDWYLNKHLGFKLDSVIQNLLLNTFTFLSDSALAQKQVLVHRDYHSRNLMANSINPDSPGVLDFQDAVIGPFTYDLVSLLRDCYINWPEQKITKLALFYKESAEQRKIIPQIKNEDFIKFFDFMGIQRHLKAIGIFSRLNYRDHKSSYLDDIPRTLNYIVNISSKYNELSDFNSFLQKINM
ncbi:MAG: aminoglycoside phosphotransferase family protein [Thiohalomonadales bacterium]